jgi:uncharacterized membrane protein YqjE
MNDRHILLADMSAASSRVMQQALDIGENRLELLLVELQEAKECLLRLLVLALAVAMFGLLAGIALTIAVVILFWERSPLVAVTALALLYSAAAALLCKRMMRLRQECQPLASTIDQLRKDCRCLASHVH